MAHLTGIGIENFRVFKDYTEFDFAPITILTGANSSGKSSLFKALLLLADNAKRNGLSELDFTGEGHFLGTFDTVKSKGSKKEEIKFTFKFSGFENLLFGLLDGGFELAYSFSYKDTTKDNLVFSISTIANNKLEHFLTAIYLMDYVWLSLPLLLEKYNSMSKEMEVEQIIGKLNTNKKDTDLDKRKVEKKNSLPLQIIINEDFVKSKLYDCDKESVERFIIYLHTLVLNDLNYTNAVTKNLLEDPLKSFYNFDLPRNKPYFISPIHEVKFIDHAHYDSINLFQEEYLLYAQILNDLQITYGELIKPEFFEFYELLKVELMEFDALLTKLTSDLNIYYLEAVRANTRRLYTYRSEGTGFNDLLSEFIKFINNRGSYYEIDTNHYIDFMNTWVKNFGIADKIVIENIAGAAHTVSLLRGEEKINLADLGYGTTQFLPILFKTVLAVVGSKDFTLSDTRAIFLLEEPETNLHPNLQAKLADFLVDVTRKFHVTLLVETHSEYLIRKLQILTKRGEIKPDDSVIYYFKNSENLQEGESNVNKITIDENGDLDGEFGKGFMDEADNLAIELHQLKHRKN